MRMEMAGRVFLADNLHQLYNFFRICGILRYKYDFNAQRFQTSKLQTCYHFLVCTSVGLFMVITLPTLLFALHFTVTSARKTNNTEVQNRGLHELSDTGRSLAILCYIYTALTKQKLFINIVRCYQRIYQNLYSFGEVHLHITMYRLSYVFIWLYLIIVSVLPTLSGIFLWHRWYRALLTFLLGLCMQFVPTMIFIVQQLSNVLLLSSYNHLIKQAQKCCASGELGQLATLGQISFKLYNLRYQLDSFFSLINLSYLLYFVDNCFNVYMGLAYIYMTNKRWYSLIFELPKVLKGLSGFYVFFLLGIYSDQLRDQELKLHHLLNQIHNRDADVNKDLETLLLLSKFTSAKPRLLNNLDLYIGRQLAADLFNSFIILNAVSFLQYFYTNRESTEEKEFKHFV